MLGLFAEHIYGYAPAVDPAFELRVVEEEQSACGGMAIRRQLELSFGRGRVKVGMLLHFPKHREKPSGVFAGLNFRGNHTTHPDPAIIVPDCLVLPEQGKKEPGASVHARGMSASRWPVEMIVARGYAVATACCGEFDPDFDDGFANGIHALEEGERGPSSGGTIAAWAWGLSRMLDALETQPEVDAGRVMAVGHSRMGKTALWAGAQDERFAGVISNAAGCLGDSLSRKRPGDLTSETVGVIVRRFPHWFAGRCNDYSENESALPVDQHELLGLMAPRPVYVGSAEDDLWADPRGQFDSCVAASEAYEMLGLHGIGQSEPPALNQSVGGSVRYHVRPGGHDIKPADWWHFLRFADEMVG